MWDEITYPFLNFNGTTIDVLEWISNFIPYVLRIRLNYVSRRGLWSQVCLEQVLILSFFYVTPTPLLIAEIYV